jgi:hypothetical protein
MPGTSIMFLEIVSKDVSMQFQVIKVRKHVKMFLEMIKTCHFPKNIQYMKFLELVSNQGIGVTFLGTVRKYETGDASRYGS